MPEDKFLFKIQKGVSAFIIDGCSIVFGDCFKENIGNSYILISGLVSTISLKIRAFHNRAKDKDAYDLFVLLKYGKKDLKEVAEELDKWKNNKFVQDSLQILKKIIKDSEEKIPRTAAMYLYPDDPDAFKQQVEEIKVFFSELIRKI